MSMLRVADLDQRLCSTILVVSLFSGIHLICKGGMTSDARALSLLSFLYNEVNRKCGNCVISIMECLFLDLSMIVINIQS